jgi:hypothetical protein
MPQYGAGRETEIVGDCEDLYPTAQASETLDCATFEICGALVDRGHNPVRLADVPRPIRLAGSIATGSRARVASWQDFDRRLA